MRDSAYPFGMRPVFSLTYQLLGIFATALLSLASDDAEPAAQLRHEGTLIFRDSFDREEKGNGATALGNGWESATANRVPNIRQADLDDGILKIDSATKAAGHEIHLHHDAGFTDGGVILRFRFPGERPGEALQVGFVDRTLASVHAGHLCYAFLKSTAITLADYKTGVMNLDIRARRQKFLDSKEPLPDELASLLRSRQHTTPWRPDAEWHELTLMTRGDVMTLWIDGRFIASQQSPGFAHPNKRWFSILAPATIWIDDVEIYRINLKSDPLPLPR